MSYDIRPEGCPEIIELPCGSEAIFDYESGIGYRCMTCMAMVGSIADQCYPKYKLVEALSK